jgi:dihydroflavonol-4-reductase
VGDCRAVKVGITGAAGFLGASLLKRLHEAGVPGDRLVPFRGRRTGNPLTDHLGLIHQPLDVTSREDVLQKTRGLDVLYHVAGVVSYARRDRRLAWDVNVLGTRNVLDAAAANGISTVVYVSSISVLGAPGPGMPFADETNDRYAPGRNPVSFPTAEAALAAVDASIRGNYGFLARTRVPYFDSKLAGFEYARRFSRPGGVRVITVLPGTAVGPGDNAYAIGGLVHRVCESRLRLTLPGGTSFVSSEDVARGTQLAAMRGRPGEAYIVTGSEGDNLSYRDFMLLVARVASERLGRRCFERFRVVPAPVARLVAGAVETFFPGAALQEGLALSGSVTHRFQGRKAKAELGYEPRVSLSESIRACIEFNMQTMKERGP